MNITVTLIAQMLAFILLIWFINKVLWKPMMGLMESRQKRIADGLAAAERGKQEQANAEKRAVELLDESKRKAADIIAQAQRRAKEIEAEAKDSAKAEAERIKAAAEAEIERGVNQAREHLRAQVASIAIAGAEKVLKQQIDAKAHDKLLSQLAAEI
ncbi:MAG: F0F1 ATP synthase subunit B [Gammaproteobacteria bacterium]|nr:F0F1 ATP synthase subunit B [Gammaproteobacteria bacterium]